MRNYLLILFAFAFAPASLYAQMFGGQLKSSKAGTISSLNCGTAINNGTLTSGALASGVSSVVSYSGGNGGTHNGQTGTSTGVTGLTATLNAGTFANGAGSLTYTITGTPSASGTASFLLNIGGQSCIINITVALNNATASCGATNVHNPNLNYGSMTDQDGNTYKTIVIGTQEWMAENLKASHYQNGDVIPIVTNNFAWSNLTNGASCWRENDSLITSCPYGKLYNGYTVIDARKICPQGWHLPSDFEWTDLENFLGGSIFAGSKMKSTGTQHWYPPNTDADNSSGFSGLPAGIRDNIGSFDGVPLMGAFWSSSENGSSYLYYRYLNYSIGELYRQYDNKKFGFSVRCLKDVSAPQGSINTIDCGLATNNGTLTQGTSASGVSSSVPYTGGNGGTHNGQTVTSTGVTGLTATLAAGTFVNGTGSLTYNITGIPSAGGTASFALNIGGQSCNLNLNVVSLATLYPANSVFCNGPTAIVEVANPATGRIWMDRNLGATQAATSSTDANAYGDLYQWGRRSDGHQCRTSSTITTLSSLDQPLHGHYITSTTFPIDWRIPQNALLWQGQLGINNPCPYGYRLPSIAEIDAERLSWFSNDAIGAFTTPLKLPLSGYRNSYDGMLSNVGNFGYYWTSNTNGAVSSNLFFLNTNATINIFVRSGGSAVRCIKDVSSSQLLNNLINCGSAINNGTLVSGNVASGVSIVVPYVEGNGDAFNGQNITSTGVLGITATLAAGTFANGAGTLTYTITGTPSASGIANFALNIGGQSCNLSINVLSASSPAYPSNSVFCANGPASVIEVTNPATGRIWMDRNLGATQVATNSTDANAYGDLFQWGRRSDGHQCRASTYTSTLSSTNQPAHGDFILAPNLPGDWRSPQNGNLWQGVNGINNPCPTSYRLPTIFELITEQLSWSNNNANGAFNSPLKLPMTGKRESIHGSQDYLILEGIYWSSTIEASKSRYLYISNSNATSVSDYRANGISIRCIKDITTPQGSINSIDCGSATNNGTLTQGTSASGVSSLLPYTGGNGGAHNGQTVTSTGVTGLTAALAAGTFANGAGSLTYTITGTPSASGTASFALNIGGQSCNLNLNVVSLASLYPVNSVFCNGPTAIVEVTNPATGKLWMDRNLGATQVATSITDAASYGDLYQWGRRSDGHQCRTSPTTSTLSSIDQPANGSFILASNSPYDWRSPQNNNLWQGVNGVNNPCPSGYRLPTEAELETERLSWNSSDDQGAFASALKFPMPGLRNGSNGYLGYVDTNGFYWSSTVDDTYSRMLLFSSNSAGINFNNRYSGFAVRCLKD